MQHAVAVYSVVCNAQLRKTMVASVAAVAMLGGVILLSPASSAQATSFVLDRENRTIVLEPYGPNIVRITMGTQRPASIAKAGYGIVGTPSMTGWTREQDSSGDEVIRSARLVVHVAPQNLPDPHPMPLDALTQSLMDHYFSNFNPRHPPLNDAISITTALGKPLLTMWSWNMAPNEESADHKKDDDSGYRVSATFDSPAGRALLRPRPAADRAA